MNSEENGLATLLGGAVVDEQVLELSLKLAPRLFCADGGANAALAHRLEPISVIGDLDSISDEARERLACPIIHDTDQDSTDFEKILGHVTDDILLCLGFLGQRLDHSLAAMNALSKYPAKRAILVGEKDICFLSPPDVQIATTPGDRVSLFPMRESRAKSRGLRWPLDPHIFHPHSRTATSNQASGSVLHLYEVSGAMLVILPLRYLEPVVSAFVSMRAG